MDFGLYNVKAYAVSPRTRDERQRSGGAEWRESCCLIQTLRMSQTTATITIMVPSNPKPSILFLL